MKRTRTLAVGAAILASTVVLPAAPRAEASSPVRIMAIGDSITEARAGTAGSPSYRSGLWTKLRAQGKTNIDFVGNKSGVYGGSVGGSWDKDHAGHWGWRADEILNGRGGAGKLAQWAAAARPDVALVHLGTNDIIQGQSSDSTVAELGRVIDTLRAANPRVKVVVAKVIPSKDAAVRSRLNAFNTRIPAMVKAKSTSASPVVVVDQAAGYSPSWNYDKVHPGAKGQDHLAFRFAKALTSRGWAG
jgi:lysophospholipase L1-like esterase